VKLHHLKPPDGAKTRKRRVGRGEAGRRGKTAGRGTKGTGARSKLRPGFEGGQLPLARRIPKLRGFNRANKEYFALVNVGRLGEFPAKATVGPDELRAAGLIKKGAREGSRRGRPRQRSHCSGSRIQSGCHREDQRRRR